jgi:alpha-2-macroglobulin-like protein
MLPRTWVCLAIALLAFSHAAAADDARRALHDATVVTDGELVRGAEATVFVVVTGAVSLTESDPVAGADVSVSLAPPEAGSGAAAAPARTGAQLLARGRTGADGTAVLRFRVPAVEPGPHRLIVTTRSRLGEGVTERPIAVSDSLHLHLRSDRAVYRPGQTIQWRVTAVSAADAHPAAGEEVEIVARDPRDTAIWRGRQTVPPSGMIAGAIPLADDMLTGTYELRAAVRGNTETERVAVREFRLPAFEVNIERPQGEPLEPGGPLSARLTARYRYGEPVQGDVEVELGGASRGDSGNAAVVRDGDRGSHLIRGRLDPSGTFAFTARVPAGAEGPLELRATVVDGAGRHERAALPVALGGDDDLRLALVPERLGLTRGALHWFTAVTTDGRGQLVPARVQIRAGGRRIRLDSPGAVRVALRAPDAPTWKLRASAISPRGDAAAQALALELGRGPVLRLRDAVVAAGEPVVVTGTWRAARGPVLATLLRGQVPIASALARIDARGDLRAELVPPPGSLGLASVRLVELGWGRARGAPERGIEALGAYLRPAELAVSIAAETRHRPGQRAELDVTVRDAAGRPVPGAALAASVVDERVLALGEPRPDLTDALRRLDGVEDATSLGLAFADLLRATAATGPGADRATAPRDAAALRAILEALPPAHPRPELVVPAEERWHRESERIARALEPAAERLAAARGAIGAPDASGRWQYRRQLWQLLDQAGWSAADRTTPWREPMTWAYALQVDPEFGFDRMAPRVAEARLDDLERALRDGRSLCRRVLLRRGSDGLRDLVARGAVAGHLLIDPWGTAIRVERGGDRSGPGLPATLHLVSAGADRVFGTRDDQRREDVFASGIGGGGIGTIGLGVGQAMGSGMSGRSSSVRVRMGEEPPLRQRFDETVLWRVGVATGAGGAARLAVPLGDSITGWKVAVEALTAGGASGAAEARMETFLPLHLDADLPPRLAVGDRYRVPIAVANHSGRGQRLVVTAALGGALRRGTSSRVIELAAGATGVVHVDAEAARAGRGSVRLALVAGGRAVDRVERAIAIDPPGELVRSLRTGDVVDGGAHLRFDVPAAGAAAAGSPGGVLRLFRGAADQARDGLDGMLEEPHGCFEQTSSTTYPDLLVLRLLPDGPRTAAARARARGMVGRGYQRLLSYEVAGGGFSWFGETPANQVLTAYGLMEFVDMAQVYPVDPALIARTRAWLLGKQLADGSWRPDHREMEGGARLDTPLATTAFVAWALAESGARGRGIDRALAYLRGHRAALARSPYLLALWAAAESARPGRASPALPLLLRAAEATRGGLWFRAAGTTLLHARGQSADVQVTALAATALARAGRTPETRRALDWLWQARSPTYGWGTTHSTVLALRAAGLAAPPAPTSGLLRARLDGQPIGTIDLASIDVPSLRLPAALAPGAHDLVLDGQAPGLLRADLRVSWRERLAPRAARAGLSVSLDAPAAPIALGSPASFTATIENLTAESIAMPTAVLPIPPGFSADPSSLAALEHVSGISRVEDHGDSIAVYLLDLAPHGRVDLAYRLDTNAECNVLLRPATAYAFYSPELRGRSAATRVRVVRPTQ